MARVAADMEVRVSPCAPAEVAEAAPPQTPVAPESPLVDTQVAERGLAAGEGLQGRLPGTSLTEQLEDELDMRGVSGELLLQWQVREEEALRPVEGVAANQLLSLGARDLALRFMQQFCLLMGLHSSLPDAALLLDVYASRSPGGLPEEKLPVVCVAVARLLKKNDSSAVALRGLRLAEQATNLVQVLRMQGLPAQEPTEAEIDAEELRILEALDWQINLPSMESWMSMVSARFDVLTRGVLGPSLEWVRKQSEPHRISLLLLQEASASAPPRKLAIGLLGLRLVSARLLPLEALRRPKLTAPDWAHLFAATHLEGGFLPICALQPEHSRRVLNLLQAAAAVTLEELQEAAELTARVLAGTLQDLRIQQAAQQPVQHQQRQQQQQRQQPIQSSHGSGSVRTNV